MQNSSFFTYPDDDPPQLAVSEELVLLRDLSEDNWTKLLSYTETQYFHIGDVIINQDDTDRGLYFVVSGQLEVLRLNQTDGRWHQVITLDANAVFGEQAFFDGKPRSAAVRAISDGTLLRLSPQAFEIMASREPILARQILFDLARLLSLRLRQLETKSVQQS